VVDIDRQRAVLQKSLAIQQNAVTDAISRSDFYFDPAIGRTQRVFRLCVNDGPQPDNNQRKKSFFSIATL